MSQKSGKIWGTTQAILQNPVVELHRIEIKPGYRCSIHKHAHKWNAFFIESGSLEIHIFGKEPPKFVNKDTPMDVTVLRVGESTQVPPGVYHCFVCREECIAFETYWPELLGEDIVRHDTGGSIDRPWMSSKALEAYLVERDRTRNRDVPIPVNDNDVIRDENDPATVTYN